jgi:hypothetical protein
MTVKPLRVDVLLRLCLLGVILTGVSCSGGNRKTVYPVKGKVLLDGAPTPEAVVVLHPEGTPPAEAVRPQGMVQADGTFQLGTYKLKDGAPAGKYAVSVHWLERSAHGDDIERVLVPYRYMTPATSGLTAEVKPGSNDLPVFELTWREN